MPRTSTGVGYVKTTTSRAAAHDIENKVPSLKARILEAIGEMGDLTCDEAEELLDIKHQTCSARFRDLKLEGQIVKSGRRATRSGSAADSFKLVEPA